MKTVKLYLICLLIFNLFGANIAFVFGASDHLVINEIYPNPEDGEKEWIELYNPTDSLIILNNYYLTDLTGVKTPLSGSIEANGYSLIYPADLGFELNDPGDSVFLSLDAILIDQVLYDDTHNNLNNAPAPPKGWSISRVPDGTDTNIDSADFKIVIPSPSTKYEKLQYSRDIIVNEILPAPSDGSDSEFIEIYNNGTVDVDLKYWQLDDSEGGSSIFPIMSKMFIKPSEYLVFYHKDTGIALNDDIDSARLIDPNGDVASSISYVKAERGLSYSYFSDGWRWTTPTPGEKNVILEDRGGGIEETDIKTTKSLADNLVVKTRGFVSVLPGILSNQYFYIQDDESGIQVYTYNKTFSLFWEGNQVAVSGVLSTIAGERRIKISSASDIEIIDGEKKSLQPIGISLAQIDDQYVGMYIKTDGIISKSSGQEFSLTAEKDIKIIIRSGTNIIKGKTKKGDQVVIAGILTKYKDSYRILPFHREDVKIITSNMLPFVGSNTFTYWYIVFTSYIIFVLWNIYLQIRKKHISLPRKLLKRVNRAI